MKQIIRLAIFVTIFLTGLNAAMTKEQQADMTPQEILDLLMEGNQRFSAGVATQRDYLGEVEATAGGQYPVAAIVSCLDSRVPVETVFDVGIGDVFVGRVAGNIEDTNMVGSLEFATKVAGSKVIMVMGHEACGAVKGAIDGVVLGNLTYLLKKIEPAMDHVHQVEGARNAKNPEFVNAVSTANVLKTLHDLRHASPLIAEMEANGEILLAGAMYSLRDGKVTLLEEEHHHDHHAPHN